MTDQLTLDLTKAREARDDAMTACTDKAGTDWAEHAYRALLDFAANHESFLTEDVRVSCTDVPPPHDNRAWGGVVNRAVRHGLIVRVGYAPAKTGHCRPMPLWRKAA